MTATLSRKQGSSTSPTATLACTQGSGTFLPDTLAHSYTPHCTPGPSPCIYKREVQGLPAGGRAEGRANEQAHSLSLSLANACNRYYEHPLVRDNTSYISFLCSILRQPIWAGARNDKIHWSARLRVPRGLKRRQLARQVGACCVLTNTFPLSYRWVVFSNLFSPGRCSASGVSSSCPVTVATTWYSSPAARQQQRRPSAHPAAANSTTSSPRGGRAAPGFASPPSSPQEEETGQPWPGRRRHLVGCRPSR
jgi:hypothetical protein